ncbi:Xylosyltransferase, family GT14 [Zostera marina]|uniref:Xylosyltransferase, family GT14 n=1 Tax=Zostera marina TaxID=29655 RepID=A0A0K9PRR3_ZOSMR|nr:Xylosyltransferase, family GT14 [Zostera marina]
MHAEKCLYPFLTVTFVSLVIVISAISGFLVSSSFFYQQQASISPPLLLRGPSYPPSFAYYISGGRGDRDRIIRLLCAVYHPRNVYLLHLSTDASEWERDGLAKLALLAVPAFRVFGNVHVVGKSDPNTHMGSTVLAATLHAASVMLKLDDRWDWFVTLSASDYPLVTQDDLSHVFSSVPRTLNFIDHSSNLGWKEKERVEPIVVDPATYLARRAQIFHATEKRKTPKSFKFFTGSPWMILNRSFIEFCILGWDNLPRTLLLYFTNVMISQEGYFHSVICNSNEFKNTTINSDLRYMKWDVPPQMDPRYLNSSDYDDIEMSGAPFARQFRKNDPVLNKIDEKILRRTYGAVPGAWCSGQRSFWADPCSKWRNVNIIRPGPRAEKFEMLMKSYFEEWHLNSSSCN